jgi:signal transduction histidine kinase
MKHPLKRRLMLALGAFTLGVSLLFGLFAMAFVYTVEDQFFERLLHQEAARLKAEHALQGRWGASSSAFMALHLDASSLPADLRELLRQEPRRLEAAGSDGRYYHLLSLHKVGEAPWLVAEVGQQLVVRPMRQELLGWLLGGGLLMVALSLALARTLARRVSAPLARLAQQVTEGAPGALPQKLAEGTRDDEVGALAQAFDALLARTRAFIAREQAFTRDASHELRTPLAVMRMAIERLQAQADLPASARAQLAPLHAATLLMQDTVQTLLLLAREAQASEAPAPAIAVLPWVEQWVLAHADWLDAQGLLLDLQLPLSAKLALPQPVLQMVLSNLLTNAVTHGERGGTVQLLHDAEDLCIRNPSKPLPQGVGEAFVKGESSAGFGLGLSIVRLLLERHGYRLLLSHASGWTEVRISQAAS